MHCFACNRPLIRCAVPNLQIGPKCAKDRGYLGGQDRRTRIGRLVRGQKHPLQLDWINNINAGAAGERAAA